MDTAQIVITIIMSLLFLIGYFLCGLSSREQNGKFILGLVLMLVIGSVGILSAVLLSQKLYDYRNSRQVVIKKVGENGKWEFSELEHLERDSLTIENNQVVQHIIIKAYDEETIE